MEETRLLPSEHVVEDLVEVMAKEGDNSRVFLIGTSLTDQEQKDLSTLLRSNINVFAWEPYELPGIDPNMVCHQLHVDPTFKPIAQKAR